MYCEYSDWVRAQKQPITWAAGIPSIHEKQLNTNRGGVVSPQNSCSSGLGFFPSNAWKEENRALLSCYLKTGWWIELFTSSQMKTLQSLVEPLLVRWNGWMESTLQSYCKTAALPMPVWHCEWAGGSWDAPLEHRFPSHSDCCGV